MEVYTYDSTPIVFLSIEMIVDHIEGNLEDSMVKHSIEGNDISDDDGDIGEVEVKSCTNKLSTFT